MRKTDDTKLKSIHMFKENAYEKRKNEFNKRYEKYINFCESNKLYLQ